MKLSALAKLLHAEANIVEDMEIIRYLTDTRTLSGSPNEIFIALKASRDGHSFVDEAVRGGVKNFLVSKKIADRVNYLRVPDTLLALQQIAVAHRTLFDIPIVGITGSNGKTTVKEWLTTLLATRFFVCKSPKSYNSQIGVPHSVLTLTRKHEIGVFEAGISQVGEMPKLKAIIQPTLGIFTTLGSAHDDGFHSKSEKLREKLQLFDDAEVVVTKLNQPHFAEIKAVLGAKVLSWGEDRDAEVKVQKTAQGLQIDSHTFTLDLAEKTDLDNITNAIITALRLGLPKELIQQGLREVKAVPMRLELKRGINGSYILDDSYNNDLEGLRVALNYLKSFNQKSKKTLILSDILSHDAQDQSICEAVNQLLREHQVDRLIGFGENLAAFGQFGVPTAFFKDTAAFFANPPHFSEEMILIKGARSFHLDRVVRFLQEKTHGTRLEVNLEAVRHNLKVYQSLLRSDTRLMVMVKANAYGAGILEVANFLQSQQVDMLGVAYADEAIDLRKNGISLPIMIMNPHIESFMMFEKYDLQAEIFNLNHLRQLISDTHSEMSVQLKVDTGMHRLGFSEDQIAELLLILRANPRIKVRGIFTHFASADNPAEDEFTNTQAGAFEKIYAGISAGLGYFPIKHACNSSGIVRWSQYHFDMVRLGIGLHGVDPTGVLNLRMVSQLKSIVSQIRQVKQGETVGYSRKGKALKDSQVAVIPIGYEDGFRRKLGNGHGKVSINGTLYPTIGNVCMDMIMVDVTKGGVREGDEVIVFGNSPSLRELAEMLGTIPYEVLTDVGSRVSRVFTSE